MPFLPPHPLLHIAIIVGLLMLMHMIVRRVPIIGKMLRLGVWALIAVLLVGAVHQRSLFDPSFAKLGRLLPWQGAEEQQVSGRVLRVPLSRDGHFWVDARINGVKRRLLIDSGATITALSVETARAAGLRVGQSTFPMILKTANGTVVAQTASVATLRIGNIVARHIPIVVASSFGDTEVVGMNFLSKLKSWRVEGSTLILEPHHAQAAGLEKDQQTDAYRKRISSGHEDDGMDQR